MYNRILNRPMFKRGGDVIDSQGTGITSGLDTPRNNYAGGGTIGGGNIHGNPIGNRTGFEEPTFKEKVEALSETIEVPQSTRDKSFWSGIGAGFGDPSSKTLGEMLWKSRAVQDQMLSPAEAKVADQKFELSKLPFELEMGEKIAKASQRQLDVHAKRDISDEADRILKQALIDYKDSEIPQHIRDKVESLKSLALGDAFFTVAAATELAEKVYGTEQILQNWTVDQIETAKADFIAMMTGNRFQTKKVESQATGGRVGYQLGVGPNVMQTNLMENIQTPKGDVAISEQIDEANVSTTQPSGSGLGENSEAYALLRARLPQEIPDDVVMLIAYNPQAFEDFAALQTQSDVMAFNKKWGVELVIPAQEV